MSDVETPLHYFFGSASGKGASPGIVIREAAPKGHLILRGNPKDVSFLQVVKKVLGTGLPIVPCTWVEIPDTRTYWLGPTEWLVIVASGTEEELETKLRQTLSGHFAIVDVSGGQTLINMSGDAVDTVLKKSSTYDFQFEHFGSGRCVQTTFAKATALVCRSTDGSIDLVIRRSFADYVAKWLLDAGAEFGTCIERDLN